MLKGNTARMVHGASANLTQAKVLENAAKQLAERRAEILAEMPDASTMVVDSVNRYLEVSCIADWLADRLLKEGSMGSKGKRRAELDAYLQVLDRQVRLADLIGKMPDRQYFGAKRLSKLLHASPRLGVAEIIRQHSTG